MPSLSRQLVGFLNVRPILQPPSPKGCRYPRPHPPPSGCVSDAFKCSCGGTGSLLQIPDIKPFPAAKEANDGGYTEGGNCDGKHGFQARHVRFDDQRNLCGRKSFTDLSRPCPKSYCWVDLGKCGSESLNQLIVEGGLCC